VAVKVQPLVTLANSAISSLVNTPLDLDAMLHRTACNRFDTRVNISLLMPHCQSISQPILFFNLA